MFLDLNWEMAVFDDYNSNVGQRLTCLVVGGQHVGVC